MTELTSGMNEDQSMGVNLHEIEALQRFGVREGVAMRQLELRDATRLIEILEADPSIGENVTVASRIKSEEDVALEIDVMRNNPELIRYAITDDNDSFIGLVSFWLDPGFFGQEPIANTYGFGYFLDPVHRGRGVVTDSATRLMEVASSQVPGIEGFTAFCVDENRESVSVLKSLGFEPTEKTYPEPTHGWLERQYVRGLVENG